MVSSEKLMYIHNHYIVVTWICRFKGAEIASKNYDTLRVQNSFLCRHGIDCIKSIGLSMKFFFWILKNLVFCCSVYIFHLFKMKLSVLIRNQKYILFVVYLSTNMYCMELRNDIYILIYLVIYIHFSGLHGQTLIVVRFLSVC